MIEIVSNCCESKISESNVCLKCKEPCSTWEETSNET